MEHSANGLTVRSHTGCDRVRAVSPRPVTAESQGKSQVSGHSGIGTALSPCTWLRAVSVTPEGSKYCRSVIASSQALSCVHHFHWHAVLPTL